MTAAASSTGSTLTLDYVHVTTSQATRGGGRRRPVGETGLTTRSTQPHRRQHLDTTGGGIVNVGYVETTPSRRHAPHRHDGLQQHPGGGTGGIADINPGGLLFSPGHHGRQPRRRGLRGWVADRGRPAQPGAAGSSIVARNTSARDGPTAARSSRATAGSTSRTTRTCALDSAADPVSPRSSRTPGGEFDVLRDRRRRAPRSTLPNGDQLRGGQPDHATSTGPQGAACDSGAYDSTGRHLTITAGRAGRSSHGQRPVRLLRERARRHARCQLTGPGQAGGYGHVLQVQRAALRGPGERHYTFSVRDGAFPGSTPAATHTFTVAALDTTITGGPNWADQRHHADVHVHRAPTAGRVPVPRRRGHLGLCTSPFTPTVALARGRRTRSRCAR